MKAEEATERTDWTLERVAGVLNKLPFVQWDRLGRGHFDEWGDYFGIFGWIARDDGRSDFVNLEFMPWSDKPGISTSSAEYSRKLSELVGVPENHSDCERVEDVFGDRVANKAELVRA